MAIPQAKPTEYKGTRFRSKSEAIFACAMDLAGYEWEYERIDIGGWLVDFEVKFKVPRWSTELQVLVEYKPAEPTKTYVDGIESKDVCMRKGKLCIEGQVTRFDALVIVYGTPYNTDPKGYWPILPDSNIGNAAHAILCDGIHAKWQEAKNYRFDIVHKVASTDTYGIPDKEKIDCEYDTQLAWAKMMEQAHGTVAIILGNSCLVRDGDDLVILIDKAHESLATEELQIVIYREAYDYIGPTKVRLA